MESKATELGMAGTLYYLFPDNVGPNNNDGPALKALGLNDHLVVDIHNRPFCSNMAAKNSSGATIAEVRSFVPSCLSHGREKKRKTETETYMQTD